MLLEMEVDDNRKPVEAERLGTNRLSCAIVGRDAKQVNTNRQIPVGLSRLWPGTSTRYWIGQSAWIGQFFLTADVDGA